MYTVQLLEEARHGYADWQTYAVRDEHNVCVCIVGEVDHLTAGTNHETALRIARALEHNCSNAFCTIREDDYPDIRIPSERAQTVEDARCAEQWVPLVNRRVAGGYNRAESLRLLSELCSAHTGDNLAAALVHNGFATEAQAASAHWLDKHIAEQAGNAALIADCPEYSEADEVADALPPVRWLRCACCGESVRGRQWFNRDHGYGGCLRCADWHTERYGEGSPEGHALEPCGTTAYDMFGVRGVHFAIPGEQS